MFVALLFYANIMTCRFTKAKDTVALKTVAKVISMFTLVSSYILNVHPACININISLQEGGILLTSYEMYSNHEELILSEVTNHFDYVIADEGHMIKNSEIDTSKALLRINCRHKIMLTGTPIQNNILVIPTHPPPSFSVTTPAESNPARPSAGISHIDEFLQSYFAGKL